MVQLMSDCYICKYPLMAAMLAAAVVTAGVTLLAVLVVVMVAADIGIAAQISAEQCIHRRISGPADTAIAPDTRLGQCCLRTTANTAANQMLAGFVKYKGASCVQGIEYAAYNIQKREKPVRIRYAAQG